MVLLAPVAALNWTVDPAGIFRKTNFGHQYSQALMNSKHGLVYPDSIDDRTIKEPMAEFSSLHECVVIGSSHVLQVSSARKRRSFPRCRSLLNLGVSGAGIEDHVVLTWLAISSGKPRVMIFGIDPWTFAFGKDGRWEVRYEDQYRIALKEITRKDLANEKISNRWSSLISIQYSKRSLNRLLSGEVSPSIVEAQDVDDDVGGKFSITMKDGSYVHSSEYIENAKITKIQAGGEIYKIDDKINSVLAIDLYRRLIMWSKEHGVRPVLLMTPYHQNAWMFQASANVEAMEATERIVRKIGSELDVPVVGSFRPDLVECSPNEFYDFMHPMASCLARFTAKVEF